MAEIFEESGNCRCEVVEDDLAYLKGADEVLLDLNWLNDFQFFKETLKNEE